MIFIPEIEKVYHTRACKERLVLQNGAHSKFGVVLVLIAETRKPRWISFRQAQYWHEPNEWCIKECANDTCNERFKPVNHPEQVYCSDACAKQEKNRRKRRNRSEREREQDARSDTA